MGRGRTSHFFLMQKLFAHLGNRIFQVCYEKLFLKGQVLGLSLLPVEMTSRQKLQDPLTERKERENIHCQQKPNPVQKGHIFLKAKMAPTKDLLIKVLEILAKGLARPRPESVSH